MDFTELTIEEIKAYYKKKQEDLKREYDEYITDEEWKKFFDENENENEDEYEEEDLPEGEYIFIF
jgi:hypothetical protein